MKFRNLAIAAAGLALFAFHLSRKSRALKAT